MHTPVVKERAGLFEDTVFLKMFLGNSPTWYKQLLIACLIINPIVYYTVGPFVAGWLILIQFIGTLALALKCFPLLPGGLLALEAIVVLKMAPPSAVETEIEHNMPIILLVLFLVPAVILMKDLLIFAFTKVVLAVRSKTMLSLFFSVMAAVLSAMLDALTVMAVVITVLIGLYGIFEHFVSEKVATRDRNSKHDNELVENHRKDLDQFRSFLRSIVMHAAVGTMLGGILTLVGEPQNLLIGELMGWSFVEFFMEMSHVTLWVTASGFITCIVLEKMKWSDYGATMPEHVREILELEAAETAKKRTKYDHNVLVIQSIAAALLVTGLVMHVYQPFMVGLGVLIFLAVFNGITEEHHIGEAIKESGSFAMVLAVFFAVVAMIHSQHLFAPVTEWIMSFDGREQLIAYFVSTGALSSISDNVFVASLYITDAKSLFDTGKITREELEAIAVAINTGTNIPSISTPNGQAAFLFLLMSALAPQIRLTYGRMLVLAFPYAVVTTIVGLLAIWFT